MTCQEMQAVLPSLAEREGTPRVAFQAAKHLSTCVSCAERLLRLRELNGLLDRLPDEEVPSSFARRVLRALPGKAGFGSGIVVLAALVGRGPGHTVANLGLTLAEMARGPFEAAASAIAGFLHAALELAGTARAALQDAPLLLPGQPVTGLSIQAASLPVLAVVGVLVLGAGLAFSRSAAAYVLERRRSRRTSA